MTWLLVAILSYFLLAIVFLVDKYLLGGPIPSPKVYAFYVGMLGILILALAPFVGFFVPGPSQILLSLLAGALFIYALFWFYKALQLFEASRVVPAVGGILPLFTFGLIYLVSLGEEILSFSKMIASLLLISGSVLITLKKEKLVTQKSLRISAIAAFFLALYFVSAKYVYLALPFWPGFIWIRMGGVLMALLFFLFAKEIRKEIFEQKVSLKKKTAGVFLSNQALGAGANILQNWAIALAPLAFVAVISALQGVQYVFLLIFAVLLSLKSPQILKEEISRKILFQKVIAILLIAGGLTLLVI